MVGVQPLLCMINGTASHADNSRGIVFTIGHSTRPLSEFMHLLRDAQIELLVDVRAVPRSRTNPQFNTDALPETLAAAGIGYVHLPALGGLRHRSKARDKTEETRRLSAQTLSLASYIKEQPPISGAIPGFFRSIR
jgi:uncharacterized protein (DUF488 family)